MLTGATSGEKRNINFFYFPPLVALVSIFRHAHAYIWNQLDEFYQMSTNLWPGGARERFSYVYIVYTDVNVSPPPTQLVPPTQN